MPLQQDLDTSGQTTTAAAAVHPTCPECDGTVREEEHETVCTDCGLVVDNNRIDHGPEWRDPTKASRGANKVKPDSLHHSGLGSEIGYRRDNEADFLNQSKRQKFNRLRTQHSRAKTDSKRDRNRRTGFIEIRRIATSLGLPEHVMEQACRLFKTAQDDALLQGRCIESFSAATLYTAARLNTTPRTLHRIAHVSHASKNRITTAYQALNQQLKLPVPPAKPIEYLPQLTSTVDVPSHVEQHTAEILTTLYDDGRCLDRHPAGVAAAVLYKTAGIHDSPQPTQATLGDAADVSPVTIRNHFDIIDEYL